MFKNHVEKGNLWEELWVDGIPKRERAAQPIYFAIVDCFCIANDIDISPEANMGGGPIDLKFSKGYHARVLLKLSGQREPFNTAMKSSSNSARKRPAPFMVSLL